MQTSAAPIPDQLMVDSKALFAVLYALEGPTHLIRELQATRSIDGLGDLPPNPINTLLRQYNDFVRAHSALHQR